MTMRVLADIIRRRWWNMESKASGLLAVDRLILSSAHAATTQEHLREVGRKGGEGLVVWAGVQHVNVFEVLTVIVPEQRALRTASGVCVLIDDGALHRLNVWLHKNNQRLIAQVHSHPGEAYHSSMDDEYAVVTAAGCFSLVVPDFAVRRFSISETAVYRLSNSGRWTEVSLRQAVATIVVV